MPFSTSLLWQTKKATSLGRKGFQGSRSNSGWFADLNRLAVAVLGRRDRTSTTISRALSSLPCISSKTAAHKKWIKIRVLELHRFPQHSPSALLFTRFNTGVRRSTKDGLHRPGARVIWTEAECLLLGQNCRFWISGTSNCRGVGMVQSYRTRRSSAACPKMVLESARMCPSRTSSSKAGNCVRRQSGREICGNRSNRPPTRECTSSSHCDNLRCDAMPPWEDGLWAGSLLPFLPRTSSATRK